ncbi:MAG TPA: NAD-dependent epimerase/dehydratase family protein [Bryobacteraceae bacterium]|nr:NAD-dependent epimerase/dehydratase family protein [Bryobacteraceae bacterium]
MVNAIVGATGAVGKALAAEFARAGTPFRVVARSEEKLRCDFGQYGDLVEYRVADLQDPLTSAAATKDVDLVFYTVGVPYTHFSLHPKLTRTALDAATASRVKRFVLVGTVYPYGIPRTEFVDESHPREPNTFKGRMRKDQEDLVLAADGRDGLRTTILRPPDFYGPESELSYASDIFKAALEGRPANVIGPVDTPHEFVFVPDVAKTLIALSNHEAAYGQSWNLAGPGVITTKQFAEMVFTAAGQKLRLRVAGKRTLNMLGIFKPMLREIAEMNYLWTTPVKLDDSRLRRLLPELRKTSYEEGIRLTLEALRERKRSAL